MDAMDVDDETPQDTKSEPQEVQTEAEKAVEVARDLCDRAIALAPTDGNGALDLYRKVSEMDDKSSDKVKKMKGIAIVNTGAILARLGRSEDVLNLTKKARPFFQSIPKARTAKIVRDLLVAVSKVPDTLSLQEKLCIDSIQWCREQKRSFLRHRLETKHASLLRQLGRFDDSLELLGRLQREVKKIDDKQLLVEINLVESRVQYHLKNMAKAKAALTSARTNANAIYVQPEIQACIDHQAGILHAEERDYKTAYSYFFEAFEAYNTLKSTTNAGLDLKYMLMSKIMMDRAHEVPATVGNKNMLTFAGPGVDSMLAVAAASKRRSLHELEAALVKFKSELEDDNLVKRHLKDLTERLLERNLCRIIEPYSRVEIAYVAEVIKLPIKRVETKLSQMILDKKFVGILNQGKGELLVQEPHEEDKTFENGLQVIKNMGDVVTTLFRRAKHLQAS